MSLNMEIPSKIIMESQSLKEDLLNNSNIASSSTLTSIIDKIITLTTCVVKLTENAVEATELRYKQSDAIKSLKEVNDDLMDKIYYLERDFIRIDQYSRRENIEIVGIPENIPQSKLENHVLQILHKMGVKELNSYNIAACHRLKKRSGNKTPNVIVRFINRKFAIECFKKKKNLVKIKADYNYKTLFIIENLCSKNQSLYEHCLKLRYGGDIKHLWSYNGVVNIKFSDDEDEIPTKLFHPDDIDYYMFDDSLNVSEMFDDLW